MKQKTIITALICAFTQIAFAATETLDEVVVTATRSEQALTQALSHTTVISRKDIESSQAADVPAMLKGLAGVELYQSGGVGKQSGLFLRGTDSKQTLVLLDGARISSATSGMTQIDQLMLDQVERIEVVRGNVSSVYGSEAIGGVIQIFTRRGKGEPSFNGSIGAGSQNKRRASAGYGGEVADTAFNVQVSKYKTDGVSAIKTSIVPGVNPDKDGYDNNSVSANVRHAFGDSHSLSASLFDSSATNQTDNPYAATTDVNSSKVHIQKAAVIWDSRFDKDWQSKLQLSQGVDDSQSFKNGALELGEGAKFKTTSDLYSWQNIFHFGENNALVMGLEKLKQRVASSTSFTRTNRNDDSYFVGYTGMHGDQQMQFNLRSDRYSDFGSVKTWLLGYGFDVAQSWRVTASMATAFKAPTLNDLFYPFTDFGSFNGVAYSYVGNPNLKPEHSRNNELGAHYAAEGQRLDVVYFDNRISDLIVRDNLPAGSMINLSEARINGVEMAYHGQFGDTGVSVAGTRQNPRDGKTGQVLLRRAKNFASVSITRQFGALKVGGEWQHSGVREDNHITAYPPQRVVLAAYDVVNLTANYAVDKHFNLYARVDNLFNRDYMLAHGFNTPGRNFFVGLNYR